MSQDNKKIDTSVKSLAVFGGSFDPIQNSHIKIVKNLSKIFDKVLVVPSYISPFKKAVKTVPADYRLAMVEGALGKIDNVVVEPFEVMSEEISYTYNTIKHIAKCYPNAKITLVIGQDNLAGLTKWYNVDELSKIVEFLVVPRKNFEPKKAVINRLAKAGLEFKQSSFSADEHSSAEARVNVAFFKFNTIPAKAKSVIVKNNFYSEYKDIVSTYKAFSLEDERIEHIYNTTLTAIELAKLHKANINDTIIASLLHDIAKRVDKQYLVNQDMYSSETVPASVIHAFNGELVAKEYFNVKKKSILKAIKFHTTAQEKMSKLEKIIFLADALEPSREDKRLNRIYTIAKTNLNWAVAEMLELTIEHLKESKKEICPLTLEAYEFYKTKIKTTPVSVVNRNKLSTLDVSLIDMATELKDIKAEKNTKKQKAKKVLTTSAKTTLSKPTVKKAEKKVEKVEKNDSVKNEAMKIANVKKVVSEDTNEKPEIIVGEINSVEPKKPSVQFVLNDNRNKDPLNNPEDMAYEICACLDKYKGFDITVINLEDKSLIADYFVIASVRSSTAVKSLTKYVDERLSKEYQIEPLRRDLADNWSAVDYGSVIMHIQIEDTRKFYDLERLWTDGTNTVKFN